MDFFLWLFGWETESNFTLFGLDNGVPFLIFGGMLAFIIVAVLAERKTHKMFYNHPVEEDEDWWEDDNDDWDDDDDEDDDDEDDEPVKKRR